MRSLRAFGTRFLIALAITTLLAVGGIAFVNNQVNGGIAAIPRVEVKTDKAMGPGKPANYLIIGSDTRSFVNSSDDKEAFGSAQAEGGQRSDTIMILHVEPRAKRTYIVSIPRDTWVQIPGLGQAKINAAFNKDMGGGPDRVIETIKQNFNVPIQHYVEVDFASFREVVDALGSVPVYFPFPARDTMTGLSVNDPGCQQLKGDMALAYVRSRHYEEKVNGRWRSDPTADLGRIKRQQDFMRRVAGEAIKSGIGNPLTARALADRTLKKLTVDASFDTSDVYRLINSFRDVDPNDTEHVQMETLPGTGAMRSGQSVLITKQAEAEPILERLRTFNDQPPAAAAKPADVTVRVLNGSGQSGLAATALNALVAAGFRGNGTGNSSMRVAQTEVHYAPGNEAKAALVAAYLGNALTKLDPSVTGTDVEALLGQDFKAVTTPSTSVAPTTLPAAAAGVSAPSPAPGDPSAC